MGMDKMKEIKNEKKKRRKRQRARRVIFVLMILLILLLVFRCSRSGGEKVSEYEKNVDTITEIDYSEQQEALNAIVEEGKMNVNYSAEAVFEGVVSKKFNVKNIKNNHYPIVFELYDEEENCIYTSKKIEPGYEINSIELDSTLGKGIHECKMKVGYIEEGNVSSVFPITIEVR